MPEDEGPVWRPSGQGEPAETPAGGLLRWGYDYLRRLISLSSEVGKLTKQNKLLREDATRLALEVRELAGKLDTLDKLIEAKVELEVQRRLEGSPRAD